MNLDVTTFGQRLAALPSELIVIIFTALPNPHLKVLATLCRKFAPIAQETLFHVIVFAPRRRQFRVLSRVAEHPILHGYVRHLAYDLSRYDVRRSNAKDWHKRALRIQYGKVYDERKAEKFCSHQSNLVKDEQTIIRHDEESTVLARYLPRLINLCGISVSYGSEPGQWNKWKVTLDPPRLWGASNGYGHTHNATGSHVDEPIRLLFRAAKTAKVPIESFTLRPGINEHVSFKREWFFEIPSSRQFRAAHSFFRKLKSIEIILGNGEYSQPIQGQGLQTQTCPTTLADLLRSAKGLRALTLGFKAVETNIHNRLPLYHVPLHMQVGESTQWTDLISLTLDTMYLHSDELTDLVTRHAQSLKNLTLRRISLISGTWADVASCLAGLSLTNICIDHASVIKRVEKPPSQYGWTEPPVFSIFASDIDDVDLEEMIIKRPSKTMPSNTGPVLNSLSISAGNTRSGRRYNGYIRNSR